MRSQKTRQSLRYLGGLLIILGVFVFGSCPVRSAISSANVISNHTCTGYTSDEISLFQDGKSAVNPALPFVAVPVTALSAGFPFFNKTGVLYDALSAPGVNSIPIYLRNRALLI